MNAVPWQQRLTRSRTHHKLCADGLSCPPRRLQALPPLSYADGQGTPEILGRIILDGSPHPRTACSVHALRARRSPSSRRPRRTWRSWATACTSLDRRTPPSTTSVTRRTTRQCVQLPAAGVPMCAAWGGRCQTAVAPPWGFGAAPVQRRTLVICRCSQTGLCAHSTDAKAETPGETP